VTQLLRNADASNEMSVLKMIRKQKMHTSPESLRTMQIQTIDLDGQTLRVATWRGSDASPPLLIFNGIGANLELVEPFVTALDDVSVIIFDVPGVGGSPAPVVPYRFSTLSVLADKLLTRRICIRGAAAGWFSRQPLPASSWCRPDCRCCQS
jgi:hypothetical protein